MLRDGTTGTGGSNVAARHRCYIICPSSVKLLQFTALRVHLFKLLLKDVTHSNLKGAVKMDEILAGQWTMVLAYLGVALVVFSAVVGAIAVQALYYFNPLSDIDKRAYYLSRASSQMPSSRRIRSITAGQSRGSSWRNSRTPWYHGVSSRP